MAMKKEEFFYDSRDKETRIHAIKWIPEEKPVCILQIIHGMAEYINRYDSTARYFAQKGFLVVGEDHLGHGESVKEGHPYGYFCHQDPATVAVRDVHRLKKIIQEEYPGVPYFILGHSMGSFILRNYLCRYGSGINGAIVMGTGNTPGALVKALGICSKVLAFFQGEKSPGKFVDKVAFGSYNARIEKPLTSFDWLSSDAKEVEKYVADPLCGFTFTLNGFHTLSKLMEGVLKRENLERMPKELPVMFVAGEEDPVGDYGKGVRTVLQQFNELGMKDVTLKIYPGVRHELVNEFGRQQVLEDLYLWIAGKLEKIE